MCSFSVLFWALYWIFDNSLGLFVTCSQDTEVSISGCETLMNWLTISYVGGGSLPYYIFSCAWLEDMVQWMWCSCSMCDWFSLQAQKKRVANEEIEARKLGLGIRLLPASKEDSDQAASIKFPHKFGLNQRNKRAAIQATSIFTPEAMKHSSNNPASGSSSSLRKKLDLLSKRRRLDAAGVQEALCSKFKPLSGGVLERERRLIKAPVKVKQAWRLLLYN